MDQPLERLSAARASQVLRPRKRVAILQSNYIPWKGYFDMINMVDEFILYDDMQYTRRDWRNRNKIKTQAGLQWLTIAVEVKGRYFQAIKDTVIADVDWGRNHWRQIQNNYARAPFFKLYAEVFQDLFLGQTSRWLSEVNHRFLQAIASILGITTKISWSMDYRMIEGKTERLVDLCRQAGATEYLSGPAARDYIEPACFAAADLPLRYMDYSGYPEYPQFFPPFEHGVTVLDLLFHTGPDACRHLKSVSLPGKSVAA